ncbi:MAG: hypothetical protein GQ527_07070 [Bacteroidales bacterium]|nr:hypothetical protein [Bacteroidales bacterium]
MKIIFTLFFVWLSISLFSQNMLLVEKPGTVNNQKYFAGDHISLKTKNGLMISGPINIIRDTNIIVDFTHELSLNDIAVVYKPRKLVRLGSSALIAGSAMYMVLDFANGGSKNLSFSENKSLQTSIVILATGVGMLFFTKKKMRIADEKWRLKILSP